MDGLLNLNPNKVGLVDNYATLSSSVGKQTEQWNGMDFTMNARPGGGMLLRPCGKGFIIRNVPLLDKSGWRESALMNCGYWHTPAPRSHYGT